MHDTDVILLWGSNAREAHPIIFHHMLKGIRNGARMVVVDPRRTSSAAFAHRHLQVNVGTDIALANAMGRFIIKEGLAHDRFIKEATDRFDEYKATVEPYTLEQAEAITGVPAEFIAETARAYATAEKAMICWTLGITEHHNAVDNVFSLINLSLLTGHIGRWGSGLNPLRGQNNVQGGGDMGAIPNRLVGFQDMGIADVRERFEKAWHCAIRPEPGMHQTAMLDAMEEGVMRGLYVIGENPVRSEANASRTEELFRNLDFMVVQDIFLNATGRLADVVLPAAVGWCETEGTVTNSERRVQLCRKALNPPGEARDDIWIVQQLAQRLGYDWDYPDAQSVWEEVRFLSPMHRGMSYARLAAESGLQWPCPEEDQLGEQFLHGRLWEWPLAEGRAPFQPVRHRGPLETPDDEYPLLLTTGRKLEFYNTGVQTGLYGTPTPQEERLVLHPDDAARIGLQAGDTARVTSRRGSIEVPVAVETTVTPGLCFMTFHHPEFANVNLLTHDATDPVAGTAEFKAAAVRVEPARAGGDESVATAGARVGAGVGTGAKAEAESGPGARTGAGTEPGSGIGAGAKAEAESGSGARAGAGAKDEIEAETEPTPREVSPS